MCSFRVAEMWLGMPISHIREIVGPVRPQTVPLAKPFIEGLVHYRGNVLAAISLRSVLGLPPLGRPQPLLVLESSDGSYGLLVDSVAEVLTVSPDLYEPNPSTLDADRRKIFSGAYKLQNRLLVVLDPAQLDPLHLAEVSRNGETLCAL
jgi:purine-binding chemotaxis protein CheW